MNDYVENVLSTKIYNKAHNKGKGAEEVFVDPATLILIGKISVTVIRLIKGCKKSREERQEIVNAPTLEDDRILKKVVRRHLGWFKYMATGSKVITDEPLFSVFKKIPEKQAVLCLGYYQTLFEVICYSGSLQQIS